MILNWLNILFMELIFGSTHRHVLWKHQVQVVRKLCNGVVNFSVLDGWWAEGYKAGAGWALKEEQTYENQDFQNELDAETIYTILEDDIIPTYYDTNENGFSPKWVSHIKNTIAQITPHYTMKRQLDDYFNKFYNKMFVSIQQG